jgi:hypothetical protein
MMNDVLGESGASIVSQELGEFIEQCKVLGTILINMINNMINMMYLY